MSDITLKIHQGTGRLTDPSLCRTCSNGMVRRGVRGEEQIQCDMFSGPITQNITECSSYYNKSLPTVRSMEQLAWTLRLDKNRKAGFVPPDKDSW
jgi:hypothetical protein